MVRILALIEVTFNKHNDAKLEPWMLILILRHFLEEMLYFRLTILDWGLLSTAATNEPAKFKKD